MSRAAEAEKEGKGAGIFCNATNCVYNDCDKNQCTATRVEVGNLGACRSDQTCCKTFQSK